MLASRSSARTRPPYQAPLRQSSSGHFSRRHDAARGEHVQLREVDEEIPVGVRGGQVAVVDLLARELERAVAARGLVRPRDLGQRLACAVERIRVHRNGSGTAWSSRCAKIVPPARPTISFAPICSGCQCVLISIATRGSCVAASTARTSASAFAAGPPSIISAPSLPCIASTLQPATWSSASPPRSVVVIEAPCARAAAAKAATRRRAPPRPREAGVAARADIG